MYRQAAIPCVVIVIGDFIRDCNDGIRAVILRYAYLAAVIIGIKLKIGLVEQVGFGYLNIRTVAVGYEVYSLFLTGIIRLIGTVLVHAVLVGRRDLRVLGQGDVLPGVSPEFTAV